MSRLSPRSTTLALLVVGILALPAWANAEPARPVPRSQESRTAASAQSGAAGWWQLLVHLLAPEGCGIDPHGVCTPSTGAGTIIAQPNTDAGCGIDPHGLCSPAH